MSIEDILKNKAKNLGFELFGICSATAFAEHAALLPWLANHLHGTMQWMERNVEKRTDPRSIMSEAKSIIVCAKNYNAPFPYSTQCQDPDRGWISRYAWGDDYHEILTSKLDQLMEAIAAIAPDAHCKTYVDTGPNMERVFAMHAGVGWVGKNTCIIHPKLGSFLFLGVILTDLKLQPDVPATDHCGKCTKCIDACPTEAIIEPRKVDARKCISYLTIEHRGNLEPELQKKNGHHLYGCDICQDVCPWNRKSPRTDDPSFQPRDGFFHPKLDAFRAKIEKYPVGFKNSPLKRAKKEGLLRNIEIAERNKK